MIAIDNIVINKDFFPDGTQHIEFPVHVNLNDEYVVLNWNYEPNEEMFIYYIKKHFDQIRAKVILIMPYIPNARMDRVKMDVQVFTLKHFATFINDLHFEQVIVKDPHSDVSSALFDRLNIETEALAYFQRQVVEETQSDVLVFPDAGASKRYPALDMLGLPKTHGEKVRNFQNGKIMSLKLDRPDMVEGKDVLIVDDICSYGGTFLRTVNALRDAGARRINLCVTHLEDSVLKGDLIHSPHFDTIYTTESIFTKEHPKVKVIGD